MERNRKPIAEWTGADVADNVEMILAHDRDPVYAGRPNGGSFHSDNSVPRWQIEKLLAAYRELAKSIPSPSNLNCV